MNIPKAGTDTEFELALADKLAALSDTAGDVFTAVSDIDNNHVEIIDRLDKTNELLERIATALETPVPPDPETLDALRLISPKLAEMYQEGRVS